jgi:hypothetical protein
VQQWAYVWVPKSGEEKIMVRAVETGNRVQSEKLRDPLPDGSSGYHTVPVKIA